jgi:multiple sugar transport system ATP-binding protein
MAEVILKNVDKVYEGAAKVVDNFNLHIKNGEFIVLVERHHPNRSACRE